MAKKSYHNSNWRKFAEAVKRRDKYKCLKCGRGKGQAVLQVHHKQYKAHLKLWEYPLSDCITLCKGCHAREHGLIEPKYGWVLIEVEDLGDLAGTCERKGCGTEIRYTHTIYHPSWGYMVVGSTCIENLTADDRYRSEETLKLLKKTSSFVENSAWQTRFTKKGKEYLSANYNHHEIRIYGKENYYSFQIVLKIKGEKWYDFGDFVKAHGKSLDRVKELAFITLKGLTTRYVDEKQTLRELYSSMRLPD